MSPFSRPLALACFLMLGSSPLLAQPPFTLASFSVSPFVTPPPLEFAIFDISFNSAVPLATVTVFFQGPDGFKYPIPISVSSQVVVGPSLIRITGPTPIVPPLPTGLYNLTRINAVNTSNKNLDLQAPLNPVPIASFTITAAPTPMALSAFSASPRFRYTSGSTGQFDLSATLTTDSALGSSCSVSVNPPSGSPITVPLRQSSFDAAAKSAVATGGLFVNDPSLPNGNYTITGLACANTSGQSLNVAAINFPGGAPAPLKVSRCALAPSIPPRTTTDTAAPAISCVAISPSGVDTTLSDAMVDVQFAYNDYESGVVSFNATLTAPSGQVYQTSGGPADANRRNGQFVLTFDLPRYAPAGPYLLSLSATDRVGNTRTYTGQDLATAGLPNTVQVTDANPDTVPPTLTSLAFEPAIIDSSQERVAFQVRVGLADNLSGVRPSISITAKIAGQTFANRRAAELTLISGSALSGVWLGTLYAEKFDFAGTYQVESVTIGDLARNFVTLNAVPGTYTQIANPSDHERPKLLSFDFSPKVIHTVGADQTITFTSTWSDDVAGFAAGPTLTLRSPSSLVSLSSRSTDCTLLSSGNALNSTSSPRSVVYRCTLVVPDFSEAGPWTVQGLNITDAARFGAGPQGVPLDTATLSSLGFPTRLFNIVPGDLPDGSLGPAGGSVTAQTNPLLSLALAPNVLLTNTSVALRLSSGNLPVPQGFSAAATSLVSVDLAPAPLTPLPSPGATLTIPTLSNLPAGTVLGLYRLDPVSGALTPAPSLFGGLVTGLVNANGNAATFAGLGALPTLLAFRRNAEVIGDVNGDGSVTCADVAVVRASLGKRTGQVGFDPRADLNRDGVVDIRDVAFVSRLLPAGTLCL